MQEQIPLFTEHLDGTLKPYYYNWDYVYSQWQAWEADPKNTGKIFNYWYGTLDVNGVIVNRRLKYRDESLTGTILMFHIFLGDNQFTEQPAPAFQQYAGYETQSYL